MPGVSVTARNALNAFQAEEIDVAFWNEGDPAGLRMFRPYPAGRVQELDHDPVLAGEAYGGCAHDLAEISREQAGQIGAERAARFWPPEAVRLPWVAPAYPM